MTFANQVAIITGAGEGIGYEIARQLAHKGASVILNDTNAERAKQAAGEISAEGGNCIASGGDVANVDDVAPIIFGYFVLLGYILSIYRLKDFVRPKFEVWYSRNGQI